jgi:hypothetical protein
VSATCHKASGKRQYAQSFHFDLPHFLLVLRLMLGNPQRLAMRHMAAPRFRYVGNHAASLHQAISEPMQSGLSAAGGLFARMRK